ncbi:MAG: FAD-dependent oxidoreductase [Pseudomonadota bacterium]
MSSNDVVVIGAGIIGLSIAWQLARRSKLKVTVLDKGKSIGEGSTGASSAVCRYRYSTDDMVRFARDGIDTYRNWQAYTGLSEPAASFHQTGVLWMPGEDIEWANREHERMNALGIPTEVLDDDNLADRFPALNSCVLAPDVETGEDHECRGGGRQLLELQGGYVDPMFAAQDLLDACRGKGVDVRFRSEVSDIQLTNGAVSAVDLADGTSIASPLVVNAAGPWCNRFFESVDITLPWDLKPVRIQVLYLDRPDVVVGDIPTTADLAAGIYFRTQNRGNQLVVSSVLEEDEREVVDDPDSFNVLTDDEFELKKLHCLHHRIPALPYSGRIRGYSGLYTINRNDVHPVLGHTEVGGFMVANGFSGHGFKLAPAVGSMMAQAISGIRDDFDTDVPMDLFSIDREPFDMDTLSVVA